MNTPYRKPPFDPTAPKYKGPYPRYIHVNPFLNRHDRRAQAKELRQTGGKKG